MATPGELRGRRLTFADLYLVSGNATESYRGAGFKAKTARAAIASASRLLKVAAVAAYIAAKQKKISELLEVEAGWVRRELIRNHDRAHAGVPIVNAAGDIVGHRPDLHASNRALELLGKSIGMFVDRHELEVTINDLSDRLSRARARARDNSLPKFPGHKLNAKETAQ